MSRGIIMITVALSIAACGGPNLEMGESLLSRQPRVISIVPRTGEQTGADALIRVNFSKPLNTQTVDRTTFAVTTDTADADPNEIAEAVARGRAGSVSGAYEFADDGRSITFRSNRPLEEGEMYWVVVTDDVLSIENIPISTWPGGGSAYISWFLVSSNGNGNSTNTMPPGVGGGGAVGSGETQSPSLNPPSFLIINEVLYDLAGSDTDGGVFVELYGDADADIAGYKLNFVNGEDGKVSDTVELPDGAKTNENGLYVVADARTGASQVSQVVGADFIVNFDPQNGPDCIQLVSNDDALLDVVGYGSPIVVAAENGLACSEGTPATRAASGRSLSREGGVDSGNNINDYKDTAVPSPGAL